MTQFQQWLSAKRRFDLESAMGNSRKAADAYITLCRVTNRMLLGTDNLNTENCRERVSQS